MSIVQKLLENLITKIVNSLKKKKLPKAIEQSKIRCWVELCRKLVMDPWGLRVINEQFPIHLPRRVKTIDLSVDATLPLPEDN